ncbi:hypothetical protein EVJ58_g1546 [Rhodofomes roseus]|uniref:Zn(2)-C6 fungal-type domain-containing protein n=1 Tax=Rhodofomes roseus TaxID=34475 RepID=A0A4Y9Z144_9APHY|nr:hypothetical protein EVJ58_g1546 [Rhodofomes roseus]
MASNVKACFRCRQKKIKCDNVRPTCQNCLKANTPGDCIYGEDAEFPEVRLLEEKIGRLQERIAFLENNGDSQPIMLHNPYPAPGRNEPKQVSDIGHHALPPSTVQELMRSFSSGAAEVGLFMHMPRLLGRSAQPLAGLSEHALALMHATRLIGAYLSADASLNGLQPVFLALTLKDLSAALVNLDPPAILDVLQTEVFLACYFFSTNRTVEGVYHMDAASAIVLANRLHKIRSTRFPVLSDSRDDIEEGESINAFWTTFILDRCWSPVLGRTPIFADAEVRGTGIDTPWPLSIEAYENHPLPAEWRGFKTVQRFLFDSPFSNIEQGPLALHAKAAALYSQARTAAQVSTYAFPQGWAELDRRIEQFINSLPLINSVRPTDHNMKSKLLIAYMLAYGAVIELQKPFDRHRGVGTNKAAAAAFDAANILNQIDIRGGMLVDPMVGVVLVSVANVLVRTLRARRQSAAGPGSGSGSQAGDVDGIMLALVHIRWTLGAWGERSAYIKDQQNHVATLLQGL